MCTDTNNTRGKDVVTDKTPSQPALKEIAAGVYAWIGVNGDSNAGAVTTKNGLVALDAQQSAAQGRAFRTAIEKAAGKRVTRLINTHFHLDHTAGNVAFADGPILAHEKTPALMNDYMGTRDTARWRVDRLDQRLRLFFGSNFDELVPADDPLYGWFVTRVQRPGLEELELVAPTETFSERLTFDRGDGSMQLDYVGPAHCDGEMIIHLPEQKVAFLGDLLFVGRFPWLGDCYLDGWIDCLTHIKSLDLDRLVPGHGDVCTLREVDEFRTLLVTLRDAVKATIRAGTSEEGAMREVSLPQYESLPRYREWLPSNVRAIYRYLNRG
jgi:glyoxylase-like metal-dependent hydrolase (beta-lactamase superfamily II)